MLGLPLPSLAHGRRVLGPTVDFPRVVVAAEQSRVVAYDGSSPAPILQALREGSPVMAMLDASGFEFQLSVLLGQQGRLFRLVAARPSPCIRLLTWSTPKALHTRHDGTQSVVLVFICCSRPEGGCGGEGCGQRGLGGCAQHGLTVVFER